MKCFKLPGSRGQWGEGKGRMVRSEQKWTKRLAASASAGGTKTQGFGGNKVWAIQRDDMFGFEGSSKLLMTPLSFRIQPSHTPTHTLFSVCNYENDKLKTSKTWNLCGIS